MKRLIPVGLVGFCAAIGIWVLTSRQVATPGTASLSPVVVTAVPDSPSVCNSAVLTQVVELTDLGSLLDPAERSPGSVPFDSEDPLTTAATSTAQAMPDRIPLATEDENSTIHSTPINSKPQ
jgi:hypothetical protein